MKRNLIKETYIPLNNSVNDDLHLCVYFTIFTPQGLPIKYFAARRKDIRPNHINVSFIKHGEPGSNEMHITKEYKDDASFDAALLRLQKLVEITAKYEQHARETQKGV